MGHPQETPCVQATHERAPDCLPTGSVFAVPILLYPFAAQSAHEANTQASELLEPLRKAGYSPLLDERLDAFPFDPRSSEVSSALDKFELQDQGRYFAQLDTGEVVCIEGAKTFEDAAEREPGGTHWIHSEQGLRELIASAVRCLNKVQA